MPQNFIPFFIGFLQFGQISSMLFSSVSSILLSSSVYDKVSWFVLSWIKFSVGSELISWFISWFVFLLIGCSVGSCLFIFWLCCLYCCCRKFSIILSLCLFFVLFLYLRQQLIQLPMCTYYSPFLWYIDVYKFIFS